MFYIMPMTSQVLPDGTTANAPKYLSSFGNVSWTCLPYGNEGWAIVSVATVLSAQSDLYSFPATLTGPMTPAQISALKTFLTNANVPSNVITGATTFIAALYAIARLFLVAQAIYGHTASAIFTGGVTPSSQVSASAVVGQVLSKSVGPFSFVGVSAVASIGSMLQSISAQFATPVDFGVGTTVSATAVAVGV